MKKQNGSKPVLYWLSSISKKKVKYILTLCVLQIFIGISSVFTALSLRALIDRAVSGEKDGFWRFAGLFAGILVLQIAARAGIRYLEEFTRSEVENTCKHRLFEALLCRDYASVSGTHSEEWMNRLTSDTVVVADGMVQILPGLLSMAVRMAGAFAAILALEVRLAYILLPGAVLLIFTTYGFRKVLKRMHKRIQETDGKLRVFLQEHLASLVIVKTFAKEQVALQEADERMSVHKTARMKRNHFSNVCNVGFATAMNGVYFLGALFCGYGILQGTVSYGTFVAVTQLIGQVQSPLANITGFLPKYYAMLASAERLMEAENFQEDALRKKSEEDIAAFYKEQFQELGFRNASFTYRDGAADFGSEMEEADAMCGRRQVVLRDLELSIKKGEYVAFTGTSGCGKSTLLKLMMCLYPLDSGERYLKIRKRESEKDCWNGMTEEMAAMCQIPLDASWRGLYAYVPQGNQLMSGSIREIICFSDKEEMQQEEKLREALEIACADEFVDSLEHGMDTVLSERGQGLSEGQMQRIAIARAVFSQHPILLLDEATSSLDEATERKVLHNLRTMTDKTVLIVTHRMAVLEICDKQIEMTEHGVREIKTNRIGR